MSVSLQQLQLKSVKSVNMGIGKTEILTPGRSETPQNVETKIGLNDEVIVPYKTANFPIVEIGPKGGVYSHIAENA